MEILWMQNLILLKVFINGYFIFIQKLYESKNKHLKIDKSASKIVDMVL